jgi:hypothetical protein
MPTVSIGGSQSARERRAWVERQERFKDLQEEYERRSAAAASPEERRALAQRFSEQRRAHREVDVRLGRRSPGLAVRAVMTSTPSFFGAARLGAAPKDSNRTPRQGMP